MTVDNAILAVFGAAPANIDLTAETASAYNVACIIFFVVAVACVILRFYVRIRSAYLWWDDYTIVAGLIFSAGLVVTNALAGQHAAGQHIWATTLSEFVELLKVVYIEPYVYACAVSTSKISVLLLYRRLFHAGDTSTNRMYSMFFWFATFLAAAYPIIMFIVMATACRPTSFFWRQYEGATDGTCINYLAFFVIFGGVNLLNDVIILLVPIPRIFKLHLSRRKKVSVVGIMLLGSFVCVASVFRIYFLNQLEQSVDASWWMGPGMAWSSLEPSAAIVSACLPTLASLFRTGRHTGTGVGSSGDPYARSGSRSFPVHYGSSSQQKANYVRAWHTPAPGGVRKDFEEDEVELTAQSQGMSRERAGIGGDGMHAGKTRIKVDTEIMVRQEERSL